MTKYKSIEDRKRHIEYCKNWYEKNKEKRKLSKKAWYEKNKERVIEKAKEYTNTHKDKSIAYHKEYYSNPENNKRRAETSKLARIRRREIFKRLLIEYKGGKCERCGYNKYDGALDFHHIDPTTKKNNLSGFSTYYEAMGKLDEAKKEADKCLLLCSNCHREEHHNLKKQGDDVKLQNTPPA